MFSKNEHFTLQLALNAFQGDLNTQWNYLLAMTVITLLPVTMVFAFLQKYITRGIVLRGSNNVIATEPNNWSRNSAAGRSQRFDARVIHGVDLKVERRRIRRFVGPSGCRQITLLRLICGLEDATAGDILLDNERSTKSVPPTAAGDGVPELCACTRT